MPDKVSGDPQQENSNPREAVHVVAMTAEQADHLKSLARQLSEPDAFDETLSRIEAMKRIAVLEARLAHERRSGVDRLPRT